MQRRSTLLLAVVCGVLVSPDSAEGRPQTDRPLGLTSLTASELELQRVPVSPLELQGLSTANLGSDYSHAIYAGRFAQQLNRLEKARNQIYVDFISSGFTGSEVPRELPSDLQMLSRTASTPLLLSPSLGRTGPAATATSSSSSSFIFPADQVFSSKSFPPRRVNRQEFVRKTRARGFPFSSVRGDGVAK